MEPLKQREAPQIDRSNKALFMAAFNRDNILGAELVIHDHVVAHLGALMLQGEDMATIDRGIEERRRTSEAALNVANLRELGNSTLEYFHLKTRNAFIEQTVKVNYAFSHNDHYELRRNLVNGLAGVSTEILEEALIAHQQTPKNSLNRNLIYGAMTELVHLSLLNRGQNETRIALPGSAFDDHRRKVDHTYWRLKRGQTKVVPLQIKAHALRNKAYNVAEDIVLLTNDDLGPQGSEFRLARLLIQENYGGLEPIQTAKLNRAHDRLVNRVENHVTLLPRQSTAVGL